MSEIDSGYILRISNDEWVEQVFKLGKYFPGIMRKYKRGTPILLVKKADERDSFIGYGIVDKIEFPWEMTPEDEAYCREHGWKCCITLQGLTRFQRPLPIKESILKDDERKGSFLHSVRLTMEQVESILDAVEEYQISKPEET